MLAHNLRMYINEFRKNNLNNIMHRESFYWDMNE